MRGRRLLLLTVLAAVEILALCGIVVVSSNSSFAASWGWLGALFGSYEVTAEEFIPLQAVDKVYIKNDCGQVTVRAVSNPSEYGVRVIRYGYGVNKKQAEESLALLTLSVEQTQTGTRIVANSPEHWENRYNNPYANLEVLMPVKAAVEVQSGMGKVSVDGLQAGININAGMGSVQVQNVQGDVNVNASMGKVNLSNVIIKERLYIHASMGSIKFKGQFGKENEIIANMGSIKLYLHPDHPAMQLYAKCNMGDFLNKLTFTGDIDKNSARGVLGIGSIQGQLTVHADMGDIKINKL